MLQKLRQIASRNLVNISGWRTDRKIVVFESDDWGSIRMPSKEVYEKFLARGISVDQSPYCKYDSLASEEDLEALFTILTGVSDSKGNNPVITANTIMANPDFAKIKASDYQAYFFEPFIDTLQKYPQHSNAFSIWKQGISNKIFYPQFHGREHLNINLWLQLLQKSHPEFMCAFNHECFGLSTDILPLMKRSIQAAFDTGNREEIILHSHIIKEGVSLFEEIFGYRSKSFIANNFIWDSSLNKSLDEAGVKIIQGMKYQKLPILNDKKRRMVRHYLGEKNSFDQCYLIRNCVFEPSQVDSNTDSVGRCLTDIKNAFFWNKPAIVSTHRINFIGFIDPDNRIQNLDMLKELLDRIKKLWPDVEFMTSVELGILIRREFKDTIKSKMLEIS